MKLLQDRRTWIALAGLGVLASMWAMGAPEAEMISFTVVIAIALVAITLFWQPE